MDLGSRKKRLNLGTDSTMVGEVVAVSPYTRQHSTLSTIILQHTEMFSDGGYMSSPITSVCSFLYVTSYYFSLFSLFQSRYHDLCWEVRGRGYRTRTVWAIGNRRIHSVAKVEGARVLIRNSNCTIVRLTVTDDLPHLRFFLVNDY